MLVTRRRVRALGKVASFTALLAAIVVTAILLGGSGAWATTTHAAARVTAARKCNPAKPFREVIDHGVGAGVLATIVANPCKVRIRAAGRCQYWNPIASHYYFRWKYGPALIKKGKTSKMLCGVWVVRVVRWGYSWWTSPPDTYYHAHWQYVQLGKKNPLPVRSAHQGALAS